MTAFRSQAPTLARFDQRIEAMRIVLAPDLGRPPNGGHVLYDRFGWGMTSGRFLRHARMARMALGLAPVSGLPQRPRPARFVWRPGP